MDSSKDRNTVTPPPKKSLKGRSGIENASLLQELRRMIFSMSEMKWCLGALGTGFGALGDRLENLASTGWANS